MVYFKVQKAYQLILILRNKNLATISATLKSSLRLKTTADNI